jgi:nitrogen-specific signal transduction histidine kinase
MANIYDKNYGNQNLIIPAEIWNNKKINGMQKMLMALLKRLTHSGSQDIDLLTRMLSEIMSTHEKDVIYNLDQLQKKRFINIYVDPISKTGQKLRYLYVPTPTDINENVNKLF